MKDTTTSSASDENNPDAEDTIHPRDQENENFAERDDLSEEKKVETIDTEEEKSEVELLQEKVDEYLSGWKRARADYENLQRDTEERIRRGITFATEGLLTELLPTVDHFNYAFHAVPEEARDSGWLQGIEHIQTNFLRVLQDHGIEMIETVGKKFDPALHEAVEEVEGTKKQKSGTIAEELSAGFTLHGKVIKCAKVKVVK